MPLQDNLIYRLLIFSPTEDSILTSVCRPHHRSQSPLPFLWTLEEQCDEINRKSGDLGSSLSFASN